MKILNGDPRDLNTRAIPVEIDPREETYFPISEKYYDNGKYLDVNDSIENIIPQCCPGSDIEVVQTLGQSTNAVMSQKAVTDELNKTTDKGSITEKFYPIGSIYLSVNNTNPNKLFGFGEWTEFGKGKALVGVDITNSNFDTPEKIGGEETINIPRPIEWTPTEDYNPQPYITCYMFKRTK